MTDKPMDAATLEALKGSIAKWEAIVAGTGKDEGENNCPLCQMFNDSVNHDALPDCEGCPVSDNTGVDACFRTPYIQYSRLRWRPKNDEVIASMATAAQAELDFLKSLLPVEP